MGIFDALTGAAGHQAADNQRNLLGNVTSNLATTGQDAFRNAGQYLQSGYNQAAGNLGTGYNAATGAINQGAGGALGYLQQGQQGAMGQLGQARSDLQAGYAPLSALASQYGQGAGLYSDALGINGAEGNQRAQAAFQPSQAYNFNLDQGLEAINRRRNAGGMLNSGNADRDAQTFGAGLASQEQGKWLDRLSGFNPLQLQATQAGAAGGQAAANLGVAGAGLLDSGGRAQAGVMSGQGNSLADLASRYYGTQAGNDIGLGNAMAGNQIGGAQNWQNVFNNALPQYNNTFKMDADASNAASANSLGLGMNLAKLGVSALGSGGLGGLGSKFGGVGNPTGYSTNPWSSQGIFGAISGP